MVYSLQMGMYYRKATKKKGRGQGKHIQIEKEKHT